MAFWKKKFFKNGTSKNGTDHKDDNGPYDNGHEIKYQGHKSKEDSPKNGSINSLEEAYANLPLVKKPDLTKRQMLPDQERSLTMEEAQRQQQSMSMEEVMKLQSMKSMTMEEAQQIQKLRHIQQQQPHAEGISGNVAQQQSSKKEKSKLKTNPPSDFIQHHHNHVNAFESYGNVPSWRNEKLSRSSPPSSNVSAQINAETNASYSPTWSSSDKSKGDQQIYRTPSPKSVNRNQQIDKTPSPKSTHYNQLGAMEKDKKIYVSSVSIPQVTHQSQQQAQCFVVNNPCMLTGSYPCYVMNVPHSTPYVPVQIYPMMLVPNTSSPNRMNARMVF